MENLEDATCLENATCNECGASADRIELVKIVHSLYEQNKKYQFMGEGRCRVCTSTTMSMSSSDEFWVDNSG